MKTVTCPHTVHVGPDEQTVIVSCGTGKRWLHTGLVARVGVTVWGQPCHHTLHATSLSVYHCTWWSWRPFSVFTNNKDSVFCIMMYVCHVKPVNSDRGTVVTYLMTTVLNWVTDWLNMWAPAHQSLSCREKGSSVVTALSSKYTQLTQYGCLYYNWLFLHKHKIGILGLGQNGIWVGCWTGLVNVRQVSAVC